MGMLRNIVVVLHLVGFALLLGAWAVEAFQRRSRVTPLMQWGMALAFVTGLVLAAPWGLEQDLNYGKIGIKLGVLLVIGAALGVAGARQKRNETVPTGLFWAVGVLTVVNAAIAVLV
ncbi:Fe-S protein [Buchananella hordeovulneris]|uniref:Fe-S protein n=1 Tax=Buchananella hordeovulneris TaxID=52770 RepID=A0A1Q5PUN1_9ACTO|nr:Fe-S protein [Buchananella hordeovulneris]OKL51303.1 Fe-S protein [Buchananella hordeovulneris]RRD52099.1 Fe-S protein [Buchananella hordeovulneris]